ncbi:MAG: class I SAM-dependent methyltransferase [Acidimicrobiia bacterium]|nr:class I SAM-dependent methyltransferase [Acidimicrobiia bacterium]
MIDEAASQLSGHLWEEHAGWWQDEFTDGVDPEYTEQILPLIAELLNLGGAGPDGGMVCDIGTGEGQVARYLAELGHQVVGVDPVRAQISEAQRRGGSPIYVRAGAARLPLADSSCSAALACLVYEHIDAVDAAIAETSRILIPGGVFVFLLNHPLLQTPGSGWIDDQMIDPPEQYWRIGPYLIETDTVEEVQKDVFIRFIHRPLSRYLNVLVGNGLHLEKMVEPAPPPGFLAQAPQYRHASTVPRLLALLLRKRI